jgi:hypothetical protein
MWFTLSHMKQSNLTHSNPMAIILGGGWCAHHVLWWAYWVEYGKPCSLLRTPIRHLSQWVWTTCSRYRHHFKFNVFVQLGGPVWSLKEIENLDLIVFFFCFLLFVCFCLFLLCWLLPDCEVETWNDNLHDLCSTKWNISNPFQWECPQSFLPPLRNADKQNINKNKNKTLIL